MSRKIAIVEDDDHLRKNYAEALSREGYEIASYRNRSEAVSSFRNALPDMAILDIMLEDEMEGGFEVCRELHRLSPSLPIIFLTARNSDIDRVSGLRLGAWDYLTKDTTTLDFLSVRVNSLFRAIDALVRPSVSTNKKEIGQLLVDEGRKQVFWQGAQLPLTLTEFWLLWALVRHPGHVKSHDQLMDAANVVVTDNAITAHIRRIRSKFKEIDPRFAAIKSEYGMGYRWVASP